MTILTRASTPALPLPIAHPPALPSLTGVRWIAAFVVFAYHLRNLQYFGGTPQLVLSAVFGAGSTAVSVFFILSGFVLAWSHRTTDAVLTSWWRRITRIGPLHLVGVFLACLIAACFTPSIRTDSAAALWANVFLVNSWHSPWWQAGNPVSWSLACEAFFSLLFPFMIRALGGRGPVVLGAIGVTSVAAIFAAPFLAHVVAPAVSAYSNPLVRLPEFVLGVVAGVAMRRGISTGPRLLIALIALVVGYILTTLFPTSALSTAAFTAVGAVLTIAALARRDIRHAPTGLTSRPMQFLGRASFGFYLVHLLIIDMLQGMFPALRAADTVTAAWGASAALVVALALGAVLHLGIELPMAQVLRIRRPRVVS